MVVVLPAPLGPSRPKHSPGLDLQVEAVDGIHGRRPGGVAFAQIAAENGGQRIHHRGTENQRKKAR